MPFAKPAPANATDSAIKAAIEGSERLPEDRRVNVGTFGHVDFFRPGQRALIPPLQRSIKQTQKKPA